MPAEQYVVKVAIPAGLMTAVSVGASRACLPPRLAALCSVEFQAADDRFGASAMGYAWLPDGAEGDAVRISAGALDCDELLASEPRAGRFLFPPLCQLP